MILICNPAFAYKPYRPSARQKACFSNIRVIQGAVEMYNMDNDTMMKELNIDDLIKGHYLKEKPYHPETSCKYENKGELDDDGFVFCTYHGDIEGLISCNYDKDNGSDYDHYEKLPQNSTIEEINANRERILKLKEKQRKIAKLKGDLKYYGLILGVPIAIILLIMSIVPSRKKHK